MSAAQLVADVRALGGGALVTASPDAVLVMPYEQNGPFLTHRSYMRPIVLHDAATLADYLGSDALDERLALAVVRAWRLHVELGAQARTVDTTCTEVVLGGEPS